jgi:hypothetical protein
MKSIQLDIEVDLRGLPMIQRLTMQQESIEKL